MSNYNIVSLLFSETASVSSCLESSCFCFLVDGTLGSSKNKVDGKDELRLSAS